MSQTKGAPSPGFIRAFLVSVSGTGLSRILGFLRDVVLSAFLGAGKSSDAFWLAFTIPNTFRRFVADEGLTGALLPALASAEDEEGHQAAQKLINQVATALILANILIILTGVLTAPWLVRFFAWGWNKGEVQFELTSELTALLMPFLIMVSLVSLFEAILNHKGHFFLPKLAPGLVSLGIMASVAVNTTAYTQPVYALVTGVLVGGTLHVVIHFPLIRRKWGRIRPNFDFSGPRFIRVRSELGKVVVIGIFAQVNILVLRGLSTLADEGSVTHYWYANRMVDLAQGIIAVAIGSALLPGISAAVASQDWDRLKHDLSRAIRLSGFFLIPSAAVLAAFALPIVTVSFGRGAYTAEDCVVTAKALFCLIPFMLSVAGINIIKKPFFALDYRNPLLLVGGFGVFLTGSIGWLVIADHGIMGLALALSASTTVQFVIYLLILRRRIGNVLDLGAVLYPVVKMGTATIPVFVLLKFVAESFDWSRGDFQQIVTAVGALLAAGLLYLGMSKLLGIEEIDSFTRRLRRH